jgi:ATP-dependent RNA helicase SUPV3L1/SUV3
VLKALGYRMERRPVTLSPAADTATANDAPAGGDEATPSEAAASENSEDADQPTAHAAADEATEQAYEEIWRPRKRPDRRRRPRAQDAATQNAEAAQSERKPRPAGANHARTGKPQDNKRGARKKQATAGKGQPKTPASATKREPAVDPDSPFAALKGLKEKMERDMQERA